MNKITRSVVYIVLVALIGGSPVSLLAQDPQKSFDDQTKLIRIKKIANEWKGSILTLHTREGEEIRGRLVEVKGGNYHLEYGDTQVQIPLEDVTMVSFSPGTAEALLSLASAFMGSGVLGGAIMLVKDDASSTQISISALIGLIGGGLWGYSTFFEREVIHLE